MAQSGGGVGRSTRLFDRHRAAYYCPFPFPLLAPPRPAPAGDSSSSGSSSDMEDPRLELPAADPARGAGGAPPFTRAVPPPRLELPAAHPARGGGAPPFARAAPPPRLELPAARPARGGGAPAPRFPRAVPPPLIRVPGAGAGARGRGRYDCAAYRALRQIRQRAPPLGVGAGPIIRRQADGAAPPVEIYHALKAIRPRPGRAELKRAYSALVRDDRLFRSLMELPEDMRKDWLLMQFPERRQ